MGSIFLDLLSRQNKHLKLVGYVIGSTQRKKILQLLSQREMLALSVMSDETKISIYNISRTLSQLEKMKLCICGNPESKKGRLYQITELGDDVVKQINQIK